MKFVIGTAQIKKSYGILGNHLKLSEAKKIFKTKRKNIDYVDTAPTYGVSENYLGKNLNKNIKIITKLDKLRSKKKNNICKEIERKIIKSFNKFNRTIYCVLFHNEDDANWLKEKLVRNKLKEMIKNKYIKKIGISCYQYKNIQNYCKLFKFDIFQIPLNALNISEKKIEYLKKLKKRYGFKIHARSIFLQGVLLINSENIPNKLKKLKKKLIIIKKKIELKNVETYNYLISIIDNLKLVDCAVIGIKNYNEFVNLINYKKIKLTKNEIYRFRLKQSKILDPRNW